MRFPGANVYSGSLSSSTLLVAAGYLVTAKLSFLFTIPPGNITPIFPAAGLALAAVMILGRNALIGVWLGSFGVNLISFVDGSMQSVQIGLPSLLVGAFIAFGAMSGAAAGAHFVQRFCKGGSPLQSGRNVLILVVAGAFGSCMISPTFGVLGLTLTGNIPWERFGYSWITWWVGDAAGTLVAAPLFLAWQQSRSFISTNGRTLEATLLGAATLLTCVFVFFRKTPFEYGILPLLLWAAYRFGMRGVSTITLLIALLATIGTSRGSSPFTGATANESLLLLNSFFGVTITCAFFFAGIIEERRRADGNLKKLNRALRVISECNQTLVHVTDEAVLLEQICRLVTDVGGYRMAWVGFAEQDQEKTVRPVAQAGFEDEYLETLRITWADTELGRGPTGTAIRTGQPCVAHNILTNAAFAPWRSEALKRGYASSLVVPLRAGDEMMGALNIYSSLPDSFDAEETELLSELADDLAFGLSALRISGKQKQAEKALRESEEKLRMLGDNLPDSYVYQFIYEKDGTPRFLYLSAGVEKLHDVKVEDALRDASLLRSQIAPEQVPLVQAAEAESLRNMTDFNMELHICSANGQWRWMHICSRPRTPSSGTILWDGVATDITARKLAESANKEAEQRLAESERQYRELVMLANSIILRWSPEGRITFLNEFGQRFFGYTAEEIVGRHVVGTIVPETEREGRDLRPLMEKICADPGKFERNVNENMRSNGERIWIDWTNKVVLDEQGGIKEILSIGSDITDRRLAEERIRRLNEDLHRYADTLEQRVAERTAELAVINDEQRTIFESADTGIVLLRDRIIVRCNRKLEEIAGYSHGELIGKSTRIWYPDEESFISSEQQVYAVITKGGTYRQEQQISRKDGSLFWVRLSLCAIDKATPLQGAVGIVEDITDERAAAEKLRKAMEKAQDADRIKSAFLATMSHELRTPLNSIIGFTGIMIQGLAGPLNPEQQKQMAMVQNSSRHLLALINDVLDISKIEAGQLVLAPASFDLKSSIEKMIGLVSPIAAKKGIAVRLDIGADVGSLTTDQRRFEQIILNLLNNAVKFTENGHIVVSCRSEKGFVLLSFSDTGIGIRQEELSNLFQPFHQIDTGLARNHEGTGLGLSICKKILDIMGGSIEVESRWEQGSTFRVRIPRQSGGAAHEQPDPGY